MLLGSSVARASSVTLTGRSLSSTPEQQLRAALDRLRAGHPGLEQLFHGDIY